MSLRGLRADLLPRSLSYRTQAKCQEGDENHVVALRSVFAAAVEKAIAARDRREAMEDKCNRLAAENQAVMSELASQRAAAARAQVG